MLSTQDMKVLEILGELESNANANVTGCEPKCNTDDSRIKDKRILLLRHCLSLK